MKIADHVMSTVEEQIESGIQETVTIMDHLDGPEPYEEPIPVNHNCLYYFEKISTGDRVAIVGKFKDVFETLLLQPSMCHPKSMEGFQEQYEAIIAREAREGIAHDSDGSEG